MVKSVTKQLVLGCKLTVLFFALVSAVQAQTASTLIASEDVPEAGNIQKASDDPGVSDPYPCHWTATAPTIDGLSNDDCWKEAPVVSNFGVPWLKDAPAPSLEKVTQAKLVWDREFLYGWAQLEDRDLQGTLTEHDAQTWLDDCFELFLKPSEQHTGYYEFHVTPANTKLDLYIPERTKGAYKLYRDAHTFDFTSAVSCEGTIDVRSDRDVRWQVEFKIAWKDFWRTGGAPAPDEVWRYSLCRYDYDSNLNKPALTTISPLTEPSFHRHEEFAKIQFLAPRIDPPMELSQKDSNGNWIRKPMTTSRVVGSPEPPAPYTTERVHLGLEIDHPINLRAEPASGSSKKGWPLWLITQKNPYGPSELLRLIPDGSGGYRMQEVQASSGDRVHYDLCFHPDFPKQPYLFLGLNESVDGVKNSRIMRLEFNLSTDYLGESTVEVVSEKAILQWPSDGHNGAAITFGLDGMLYITSGDGTTDSDTNLRGQDLTELTAKVLRIDVDRVEEGKAYSIPEDNPFIDRKETRPETWAYGLRNPWRITTDSRSGRIWIGQNGQDLWEQVYLLKRGANYGWSVMEGASVFYANRKAGPDPIELPVIDHHHSQARSLTGGIVYQSMHPDLQGLLGDYVYGDYSTGKIWAIKHDGTDASRAREIADTPHSITAFEQLPNGEIWVADHLGKAIVRLVPNLAKDTSVAFPKLLSETGLFQDVAKHQFASGVIPYSVNSPLWSDGAAKVRAFAIPGHDGDRSSDLEAHRIEFQNQFGWTFPNDTVLIKSFALEVPATRDEAGARDESATRQTGGASEKRWIETRLMVRQQNEWVGYSYRWNDDGTDAALVSAEGGDVRFIVHDESDPTGEREQVWHYPSRAECMVCHSRAANFTLGLQTAQLNRDHDYAGEKLNQLVAYERLGLLKVNPQQFVPPQPPQAPVDSEVVQQAMAQPQRQVPSESHLLPFGPDRLPKLVDPSDASASLSARVQAYLHSNCASCHAPAGGGNSAIDLQFPNAIEKMGILDAVARHQDFGIEEARLVAPGRPEKSILLERIAKRGNGQMPPIASNSVDRDAVKLLQEWIASLPVQSKE